MHVVMGWDYFFEPQLGGSLPIPHELVDTALSALAFMACLPFRAPAPR
jgi:hypothetical protein